MIIEDNGIGIDMQYAKSKIFQLYQRFNMEFDGKGMGLYLLKTEVEAMGGRIEVSNRLNNFTRFEINWPMNTTNKL